MSENKVIEETVETPATTGISIKEGAVLLGVGAAVGAAAALLLTPKSGSEMRGDIADAAKKGIDATKKGFDATVGKAVELSEQAAGVVDTLKEKATAVYDTAADRLTAGADVVAETAANVEEGAGNVAAAVREAAEPKSGENVSSFKSGTGRKSSSIV